MPQSTAGLDPSLGFGATFDTADAVQMIWQNLIPGPDGGVVQFFPRGHRHSVHHQRQRRSVPETVMYLTLHADTAGGVVQQNNKSQWTQPPRPGTPRWRSMQTAISTVGVDFTERELHRVLAVQRRGEERGECGRQPRIRPGPGERGRRGCGARFAVRGGIGNDTIVPRAAICRRGGAQHGATIERHLQRPDRRHRHPGRYPADRAARPHDRPGVPPLPDGPGDLGADIPLGRPERAVHPG